MAGILTQLREAQETLSAKQATLAQVWKEAGEDIDFSKVKSIDGDSVAKAEKVRSMDAELNDLFDKVKKLTTDAQMLENQKRREQGLSDMPTVSGNDIAHSDGRKQAKTLGEMIIAHEDYREEMKSGKSKKNFSIEIPGFISDFARNQGVKTLFQTSAGWSPESTRTGILIDAVTRPIQVTDVIPASRTGMAAVVYMEETTRTHANAERSEAGAYAESAFALTQRSSTVRSIGTSIPVTDEQLADEAQVASYLSNRLIFGARQRLDTQILTGNGTPPNLTGLNNASGLQTQAKGADPTPDTFYKAMTLIKLTGRAFPSHHFIHPTDWQEIKLLRTADGIYIWGSPSENGPDRLWGLPVVVTDAQTQNTGLTGDVLNFCSLFERQGIEVETGYVNDDFTKGQKTLRAGVRVAFVTFRGAAFCQSTGI